jgi:hypothetical protein
VLEAVDLVQRGVGSRVALFAHYPTDLDREFIRRGIAHENRVEQTTRWLRASSVTNLEEIPYDVTGTEDEGRRLPEWCDQHHVRSVVVVSSSDHSRRLARVLRRAMTARGIAVIVRTTRYSDFDPDHWWQSRSGTRTGIVELQKLLLDVARHPLS